MNVSGRLRKDPGNGLVYTQAQSQLAGAIDVGYASSPGPTPHEGLEDVFCAFGRSRFGLLSETDSP